MVERAAALGAATLGAALRGTPTAALGLTARDINTVPRERIGMLAATVVGARSTGGVAEAGATPAVSTAGA